MFGHKNKRIAKRRIKLVALSTLILFHFHCSFKARMLATATGRLDIFFSEISLSIKNPRCTITVLAVLLFIYSLFI